MRKILLTALGSAALVSGAMLGSPAGAMTVAAPSTIGIAATDTGLVQVRYYRRYYHHRYYNYNGYGRPYGYYGVPFLRWGW